MTLTKEELRRILEYDPWNGKFRWMVKRGRKIRVGDPAGSRDRDGYIVINIGGKIYKAHRLAWLYYYGEWLPKDRVMDHINRKRDDNRIDNLRVVIHAINRANSSQGKNNAPI